MREIKFKCWDDKDRIMREKLEGRYWMGLEYETGKLVFIQEGKILDVPEKRFILMQYTGLKDKNGVEIYEGDILSRGDGVNDGFVEYVTENEHRHPINGYIINAHGDWLTIWKDYEVIGNIYETNTNDTKE